MWRRSTSRGRNKGGAYEPVPQSGAANFVNQFCEPGLGTNFVSQVWGPSLGTKFGDQVWGPSLGTNFVNRAAIREICADFFDLFC
jgi:hypothetical protein